MKKILILFLFIFIIGFLPSLSAQDPVYTQFTNTPLYYNPAYTGLYNGLNFRFSTKSQSQETATTMRSYYLSADVALSDLRGIGGVGIIFNSDNEGLGFIQNYDLGLLASVRVPLTKLVAGQVGIKASWLHKSIFWDEFKMSDQVTERYGHIYDSGFVEPGTNALNLPDFAIGGVVHFVNGTGRRSGTIGIAADHLFEPDQSFLDSVRSPLPRKWIGHIDLIWALKGRSGKRPAGDVFKFNPGILYQHQRDLDILIAGMNVTKSGLYGGLWYKGLFGPHKGTSLSLMAGYRYVFAENMSIKFTYCYDKPIAGEMTGKGGAHEIGLFLEFGGVGLSGKGMKSSVF